MRNAIFIILTFFALTALAFPFNEIFPRQKQDGTESVAPTSTQLQSKADSSTKSADSSGITESPASTGTDEPDSKQSKTSSKSTKPSKTKGVLVDPLLPAGGVSMITPGIRDVAQYYKFGDNVTFVWNYTSLVVSPTAVNIIAVCSNLAQEQTCTISKNVSMKTTSIVWDTKPDSTDKQTPLVMGTYTLIIYDDSTSPTDVAPAGYLAPGGTRFGMYSPRLATPLASYECAVCENSGVTNIDAKLMRMLVGTGALFLVSFFWFARGSL